MPALIEQIFLLLRSSSVKLLTLAGSLLLIWGTVSPVGTLVWWLQQEAESLGLQRRNPKTPSQANDSKPVAQLPIVNCYIVFLSGVGDFSADQLTAGEAVFLEQLVTAHPNCAAVKDVFPYSAANESLGGRRLLAPLWRFADEADGWLELTAILIKIRNLWRFAISVDNRYGPLYNQGVATAIIDRMNAAYPISPRQPLKIVLIGTSGGAQVALGAATYLKEWLDVQLIMVSVGGVFAGDEGFNSVEHVYHLQGRRDWIEDLGPILFPSRWPWTVGSPFNQARQRDGYTAHTSGPHTHDGPEGYFGQELARVNGTAYVDLTFQQVNRLPIWLTQR